MHHTSAVRRDGRLDLVAAGRRTSFPVGNVAIVIPGDRGGRIAGMVVDLGFAVMAGWGMSLLVGVPRLGVGRRSLLGWELGCRSMGDSVVLLGEVRMMPFPFRCLLAVAVCMVCLGLPLRRLRGRYLRCRLRVAGSSRGA